MRNSRWVTIVVLGASLAPILEGCGGVDGNSSGVTPYAATTTNSPAASSASNSGSSGANQGSSSSTGGSSGGTGSTAGSPPTPPPFWIPFQESPQSGTSGNNGVYVIPANAISSTPVALTPSTTNATLLGVANAAVTSTTGAASSQPSLAMYSATGPDNLVHIYGVNLAGSANPPTVTQIGSLSVDPASGNQVCRQDSAQRDESDPSTLFVVVRITNAAGPFACAMGGTLELVNFTDTPVTAPTPLSLWSINIQNIYGSNGQLGGLLTFNASSQLVFYPADQLDGPGTVVVDKAAGFGVEASTNDATYIGVVRDETVVAQELYKLTPSGVISLVYTSQGTIASTLTDSNNLYLVDNQVGFQSTLVQISLQSGSVQSLYTLPTLGFAYLIESTGSGLIFAYTAPNGGSMISTLPLNVPSPQPSVLASVPGTYFSSAFLDSTSTYLYVNYRTTENGTVPGTAAFRVSTGQQMQVSSGSMFIQGGSNVLLLSGVASMNAPGGATVYNFDPAASTQTPLSLPDGSPYTLPQGFGISSAFSIGDVGAINLLNESGATTTAAAVYDASTNVIVPLSSANNQASVW